MAHELAESSQRIEVTERCGLEKHVADGGGLRRARDDLAAGGAGGKLV